MNKRFQCVLVLLVTILIASGTLYATNDSLNDSIGNTSNLGDELLTEESSGSTTDPEDLYDSSVFGDYVIEDGVISGGTETPTESNFGFNEVTEDEDSLSDTEENNAGFGVADESTYADTIVEEDFGFGEVEVDHDTLESKEILVEEELLDLCSTTLIIQGYASFGNTQVLSLEQYGDIYIVTYETSEYAKEQYEYYSNLSTVTLCEFDTVVATQTTVDTVVDTDESTSDSLVLDGEVVEFKKSEEDIVYDYESEAIDYYNMEDYSGVYIDSEDLYYDYYEYSGGNVSVAVLDSGATGYYDNSYNTYSGTSDVTDVIGHGTEMISIIEEYTNATIIPIKVVNDEGIGTVSDLIEGIEYAKQLGVTVINMSLITTYSAETSILETYISSLSDSGMVIVASAGNEGNNVSYYTPANIESIIVVGSSDSDGNKKEFSNWGDTVDYYVDSNSTSEAAATVSGLIANSYMTATPYLYTLMNTDGVFWQLDDGDISYADYYPVDNNGNIIWCGYLWFSTTNQAKVYTHLSSISLKSTITVLDYVGGSYANTGTLSGTVYVRYNPSTTEDLGYKVWYCGYEFSSGTKTYYVHLSTSKTSNSGAGWYKLTDVQAASVIESKVTYYKNNTSTSWDTSTSTSTQTIYSNSSWTTKSSSTFSRTGYTFNKWSTSSWTGYAASTSQSARSSDLKLFARWTANTYTVKYAAGTGGSGSMDSVTHTYDTSKTLTSNSFTRTGYTFNKWSCSNGSTYSNKASVLNLTSTNGGSVTMTATWTANTYTVNYAAGGGSGSMSSVTHTYGTAKNLTANAFTRTGYTFSEWSCNSKSYTNKQSVSNLTSTNGGSVTMTAQWTANTYKVTYAGNSQGTSTYSGSTSTTTHTYNTSSKLASNGFSLKGYTFQNWNTKANGTGTDYAAGASVSTLSTGSTVPLYAEWKANTYYISYNSNKPSTTSNSVSGTMSNSTHIYDTSSKLTANAYSITGYKFTGWNTKSAGTGTSYSNQASISTVNSTAGGVTTLYAQWTAYTLTITYNANGGSGTAWTQTFTYDKSSTINSNLSNGNSRFTKTGYSFQGWSEYSGTSNSFSTTYCESYKSFNASSNCFGKSNTSNSTDILYAIWQANKLVITYNANGGTGDAWTQTVTYDTSATINSNKNFTKTGYTFMGWSESKGTTSSSGTSNSYSSTYCSAYRTFKTSSTGFGQLNADILTDAAQKTTTLYAKWEANTLTITYNPGSGGSGSTYKQVFTYGTSSTILGNSGFTKTGYTFQGWATSSTATSCTAKYCDGYLGFKSSSTGFDLITADQGSSTTGGSKVSVTLNLYALWQPNKVTITYNDNTTDTVTSMPTTTTFTYDTSNSISSNTPNRTGYRFVGWSTTSTATSRTDKYDPSESSSVAMSLVNSETSSLIKRVSDTSAYYVTWGSLNLYAVWEANTAYIVYMNDGTDSLNSYYLGSGTNYDYYYNNTLWTSYKSTTLNNALVSSSLLDISDSLVWYAARNSSGSLSYSKLSYANASSVDLWNASGSSTNLDLYKKGYTYTGYWTDTAGVRYSQSAGQDLTNVAISDVSDVTLTTLATSTGTTGYDLSTTSETMFGSETWNTTYEGLIGDIEGYIYMMAETIPNTYTIKYDNNGGTGSVSTTGCTYDFSVTLDDTAISNFAKNGYTLRGWSLNASSDDIDYELNIDYFLGETITVEELMDAKGVTDTNKSTITLYAVWEPNSYWVAYHGNGGTTTYGNTQSYTYTDVTGATLTSTASSYYKSTGTAAVTSKSGTSDVYYQVMYYDVPSELMSCLFTKGDYYFTGSWVTDTELTGTAFVADTIIGDDDYNMNFYNYEEVTNLYNTVSGLSSSTEITTGSVVDLWAMWNIGEVTNTYYHWAVGLNTSASDAILLDTVTNATLQANIYSVTASDFTSKIPNGFEAVQKVGTDSLTISTTSASVGSWVLYALGDSALTNITQQQYAMDFEFYYTPTTYNITYKLLESSDKGSTTPVYAYDGSTTYTILDGLYSLLGTDPTRVGYTFIDWDTGGTAYNDATYIYTGTGNDVGINTLYTAMSKRVISDVTVTATWYANDYTITTATLFDESASEYNGELDNDDLYVYHSYDATYDKSNIIYLENDQVKEGYTFIGWSLDESATVPDEGFEVDADSGITVLNLSSIEDSEVILYSVWETNSYSVDIDFGSEVGYPSIIDVDYNESFLLPSASDFPYDETKCVVAYSTVEFDNPYNPEGTLYQLGEMVIGLSEEDASTFELYPIWNYAPTVEGVDIYMYMESIIEFNSTTGEYQLTEEAEMKFFKYVVGDDYEFDIWGDTDSSGNFSGTMTGYNDLATLTDILMNGDINTDGKANVSDYATLMNEDDVISEMIEVLAKADAKNGVDYQVSITLVYELTDDAGNSATTEATLNLYEVWDGLYTTSYTRYIDISTLNTLEEDSYWYDDYNSYILTCVVSGITVDTAKEWYDAGVDITYIASFVEFTCDEADLVAYVDGGGTILEFFEALAAQQ